MWGIGYALVDMRIKKLLRRLLATPMRAADFLAAQMVTRLLFTVVEVGYLLGFAWLALGVPVRGSLFAVLAVALLGAMSFAGLGLAVASRPRKIETVSGLMNLVMLPMFVGSGVFFSVDRFPQAVQPFLRALPLTALNDALRAVTLEGASLVSQADRAAVDRGLGRDQLRRRACGCSAGRREHEGGAAGRRRAASVSRAARRPLAGPRR